MKGDEIVAAIIRFLPYLIGGCYILVVIMGDRFCKYLEEMHKFVKRHWRFLDALSSDLQKVKELVEETKKRASEFGDSELNLEGITQPLQEIGMQWVSGAGNVVWDAQRCVQHFRNLMAIRTFLNSYLFVIFNLMTIFDLFFGMRRTVEDIKKYLKEQKELNNNLCQLLEQSRNAIRSLQNRPFGTFEQSKLHYKVLFNPVIDLALVPLTRTRDQNSLRGELAEQLRQTVIKVKLLQAFVKDLQWFTPESEIGKAWTKEAEDAIKEADEAINTYLKQEARIVRWPVAFGLRNWWAERKLKKGISDFDSKYLDLLEANDRYGFRFIRRVSSKQVRPRLQRMNDRLVSIALDSIRREVPKITADYSQEAHHSSISSLCKRMEEIQQLLKDEKATEGARHARMACFDLLEKLASDAKKHVENYKEASPSKLLNEINRIHNTVELLHKMVRVCTIQVIEDSCSVVGLEEDVHKIVSNLIAITNDEGGHLSVISIVGTKGIGKTTLAREICKDRSLLNHFKDRCFVSLRHGDRYANDASLLKDVRDQILPTRGKGHEKEIWIDEIRDFLKKQACLVVLDNLQSTKAWDVLKPAFPDESKSAIMITTCRYAVASHANPSDDTGNIHRLRLLTGEESWELFTQMVSFPSDSKGKIRKLAKKVVARTGGLPVDILRLGYRFSGKCLTEEGLLRVLERGHGSQGLWSETWEINKGDFQSNPILDKCFSYSEFFPRDFEIPTRRLVALWVASGLFKNEDIANDRAKQVYRSIEAEEEKTSESDAFKYLLQLVDRNMIQVVERKRDGNVKMCRFPNTLVEIWLRDTRMNMTRGRSWSLFSSFDGQLAYRFDDKDTGSGRSVQGLNSDIVFPEEKYPRSIMFFDTREGNEPGEDISKFLLKGIASWRFEGLEVLDLEGVFRPNFPDNMGKLKKLKYLGLRWTYLENLPDFIGSLSYLQTLDLKHTNVRELPRSSWKLKSLRNLYLNQNCRIEMLLRSAISTKNLKTLCGVFVDSEGSDFANNLSKFQSLQKLGITIFQLPVEQQKDLVKGIAKLTNLRSLTLRSINEKGEPQDFKLKSFEQIAKLRSLYLLGKLQKPAIISDLPKSLTELTLSSSGLLEDPMPKLGKLPNLKFLYFLSGSYQGTIMVCSKEDFPELLVLHMWRLPNLEKLEVKEGAMQKLREFQVRSCQNLRFAIGLTNLKVLQVITLKDMPDENAIENEFAAAKENSHGTTIHCPKINRKKKERSLNL